MNKPSNFDIKSWVKVDSDSHFPIQNLPFGVFKTNDTKPRVGVAIGNQVLDLAVLYESNLLKSLDLKSNIFDSDSLNPLIGLGKVTANKIRNTIFDLLKEENTSLRDNAELVKKSFHNQAAVQMMMPVKVGDYTDFYSSIEHATNVGIMFRDPANALLPNWKHLPVGYHGRASSIVVSGTPVIRPKGQTKADDQPLPSFGPTKQLDFELEMAFITYPGKPMGHSISTAEAIDYIFGMVLFNDWSARDIQKWEYIPLGPFLAKNFASSISAWVVMMEALEPFQLDGPMQEPEVLPYLKYNGKFNFDIKLEVFIAPEKTEPTKVSASNYKFMYWNLCQQLAHHTINGCNINAGDMMASGTISGSTPDSYGSMLELAWKGTKPIALKDGTTRIFIKDFDTVTMTGCAEKNGIKVGFGEVSGKILPAI
jgi:fumarylacetoacetase